ncbi:hypothetical protein MM817_02962 [Acidibacillus sp. S0AB]|uniref:Transposase n=2 Tax=Sulfoacidibacillus ferrooxidans TaxID=2005001 RepID=A0A9X1VBG6_9BACL|nr:hypothetical protein [Sulfoacidibacillus ferrooxidans]
MRLALALHMRYERMTKEEAFERTLRLIQAIPDPHEQSLTTIVMLWISGRMMTEEQEKRLKEALKITNILREIIQEAEDEGIKAGREKGLEQARIVLIQRMLVKKLSPEEITNLTDIPRGY